MDRFTIRWDISMGCYRVSIPNFQGPLEVVPAEEYDRLRDALDALAEASVEFTTAADYTVNEAIEEELVNATHDAFAALDLIASRKEGRDR